MVCIAPGHFLLLCDGDGGILENNPNSEDDDKDFKAIICLSLLIEAGTDVNARGSAGKTPVYLAASRAKPDIVKWLLNNGADAYIRDVEANMLAPELAELEGSGDEMRTMTFRPVIELMQAHRDANGN